MQVEILGAMNAPKKKYIEAKYHIYSAKYTIFKRVIRTVLNIMEGLLITLLLYGLIVIAFLLDGICV